MTVKEIKENSGQVCEWVIQQQVKRALGLLRKQAAATEMGDTLRSLEELELTYENILRYTLEGVDDPERMKVYNHLRTSILALNEEIRATLVSQQTGDHISYMQSTLRHTLQLPEKQIISAVSDLPLYPDVREAIKEQYGLTPPLPHRREDHDRLIKNIFLYLWLKDRYREPEMELIRLTLDHTGFTWFERALFVSAVTLSLFRYFDLNKFTALHQYFLEEDAEVRGRSLVGMILSFYLYDQRLVLYPELLQLIEGLKEEKDFLRDLEAVTLQIIRARETENIGRKLKDEIIPEIRNMGPDLQEKLNLDHLMAEDFSEEKNPDWKKMFKGSEALYEKMEEFSKLQMEGADVFMSAFAHLKNFPFFEEIENWFIPFLPEHKAIEQAMAETTPEFDTETFLDGLRNTAFLCNSDKYSFCLNLKILPTTQKEMILNLFNAELEGMKEMEDEDSLIKPENRIRAVFAQYLQDIYRFFKLYRHRDAFDDIFTTPLDIYNGDFFNRLGTMQPVLENIGNYFFEHNQYEDSLDVFLRVNSLSEKPSYEVLEKIGYAYQKMQQYDNALHFYHKAELFDANKSWLTKKIAFCYRKIKKPEQALKYYRQAEQAEPESTMIQTAIGHCYLDKGDFKTAIKYYFKVEYQNPDDVRIQRPVAWCYFALRKLDQANKYYVKILDSHPTGHDYLNAGHVAWCQGDKQQAIKLYQEAIRRGFENYNHFLRSFRADQAYLLNAGIDPFDIPLMLEYLEYLQQEEKAR